MSKTDIEMAINEDGRRMYLIQCIFRDKFNRMKDDFIIATRGLTISELERAISKTLSDTLLIVAEQNLLKGQNKNRV